MSAIKKIFGAILAFLTSAVTSVLGIFSKKKKGEFFLEIDPSKDGAASANAAVAAPEAASKSAPKAKKAKPKAQAAKSKAKKAKPPKKVTTQATPEPQVALSEVPAAASLINQALNMPKPKVATIEPLDIPKFGPRRRPGSNMQSFLDMAKTVKS